jgi:hypothetical protein
MKHCLAQLIVSNITTEGPPDTTQSFLPLEFIALPHAIKRTRSDPNKPGKYPNHSPPPAPLFTQTTSLLTPPSQHSIPPIPLPLARPDVLPASRTRLGPLLHHRTRLRHRRRRIRILHRLLTLVRPHTQPCHTLPEPGHHHAKRRGRRCTDIRAAGGFQLDVEHGC